MRAGAAKPTRRRPQERTRDLIFAGIAVVYTLFLIYAAGMKFLLLSAILYAPGDHRSISGRGESRTSQFSRRSNG